MADSISIFTPANSNRSSLFNSVTKRLSSSIRVSTKPVPFRLSEDELAELENEPLPNDSFKDSAPEEINEDDFLFKVSNENLENDNGRKADSFFDGFDSLDNSLPSSKNSSDPANAWVKHTDNLSDHIITSADLSTCKDAFLKPPSNLKNTFEEIFKTPVSKQPYSNLRQTRVCTPYTKNEEQFEKIFVNNREFMVINVLGRGGSSVVYSCVDVSQKVIRAIKSVSLENPVSAEGFINEVKLLKKLQNCNRIIKLYEYEIDWTTKKLLIVMEMGSFDLSQRLKELSIDKDKKLPIYILLCYWMEMLYAVQQIHSHGIIHTDLKPANFLHVGSSQDCLFKLIDFGISKCLQSDMTSAIKTVSEGSFEYVSPEALVNETSSNENSPSYGKPKYKISYKTDVWSLGCILYQLIYGAPPFRHIQNPMHKFMAILSPSSKVRYPSVEKVPQALIEIVKKCLVFEMRSRPSINQLIEESERIFHF